MARGRQVPELEVRDLLNRRALAASFAALALSAFALSLAAQAPKTLVVQRTPTAIPMKVPVGVLQAYVTPIPRPTVPVVEGHPLEKAILELRRRDFSVEIMGEEPSTTYEAGSVARQDPAGGVPIPAGPRVVKLWKAVPPLPVTVAVPTLTPTPVDTATPVPTAKSAPEAPSPTPAEAARPERRPARLPPTERPARPTARPPSNFSWLVVAGLAALAAGAWLALRMRTPDGGKDGPSRAPDVEILPRSDLGTQEIASPQPATSGLTFHAVPDPGKQSLAANGPLVIEGKTS